ncbi:MAG: hypothetical protein H0W90_17365 [Actinobacteria bacterium]|nr:hypothetical protein [Actinomycetota bacterium]
MIRSFALRMKATRTPRVRGSVVLGVAATAATLAVASGTHSVLAGGTPCIRMTGNVAHYCGPASARLSVFSGVVFRHGSCTRKKVDGVQLLQVRIGSRSLDGSRTNAGLTLFSLGMSGSRSGGVVAYYRSKRWLGRGVSFKGGLHGGTFVAQGVARSGGRATGSFRC